MTTIETGSSNYTWIIEPHKHIDGSDGCDVHEMMHYDKWPTGFLTCKGTICGTCNGPSEWPAADRSEGAEQ